jgi:hypothetical protein
MCDGFFNRRERIVLDYTNSVTANADSWWYELWPNMLYAMLVDLNPGIPVMQEHLHTAADRWLAMDDALRGPDGVPNYNHRAFDFVAMKPIDKGPIDEADIALGNAWLQYVAYRKWKDARYLKAAEDCLTSAERLPYVPNVETTAPFGALAAVRTKAELGRDHEPDRLVRQCFDCSDVFGCATTIDRWGGYDVCGLWGDTQKAYFHESVAWAMGLVPVVRYDPGYARAIGKWMLNLANSLRLFFPGQLPAENCTNTDWTGDPLHSIPYESLRLQYNGKSPAANSDARYYGWKVADFSLYSGAMTGFLGAMVSRTNVDGILRIDLLATDFYRDKAYPSFLYYNPYPEARTVAVDVGRAARDIYDAATKSFLARGVMGETSLKIPGDHAVVAVIVPAGGRVSHDGRKLLIDGVVVDYDYR